METTSRINANGLAAVHPPAKRKRVRKTEQSKMWQFLVNLDWPRVVKVTMTVLLGTGIPLLSLALSKMAGTLAAASMYPLALFAFGLMVAVLGVSLSHLAWAIGNVTRSDKRASWALAIALDLSLVLCELCHVYAGDLGLTCVAYAVMACVAVGSMALNVWAFLMHE